MLLTGLVMHMGSKGDEDANIQASMDTTISGYIVPSLTPEQVVKAYNRIAAGKSCTITNRPGDAHYAVLVGNAITGEPSIVFAHHWNCFVHYQVTSQDTVEITVYE